MTQGILTKVVPYLLTAVLCGCASQAGFEATLNSWIGSTEEQLVSQFGPPANVYTAPSGERILTYRSGRSVYVPGVAPSYHATTIGNTTYVNPVGGSPGFAANMHCTWSFSLRDNRVYTWRWEGNDCRA
jgi:hypothetical protein